MSRPRNYRLDAVLVELHSLQTTQRRMAELLGKHPVSISLRCKRLGLRANKAWGVHATNPEGKARAAVMVTLFRDGYTLQQIGDQFGITRERVRQIIFKHAKLKGDDGGEAVRTQRKRHAADVERETRYHLKYGCSREQWQELRRVGREMLAAGKGLYQTPLRAWSNQRNNAMRRGISWELNVWQWWTIWQQSGLWEKRGRGQGYVMCRKGDVGPYSIGNVFIATGIENTSEGQRRRRKDPTLPPGVNPTRSGKYRAYRQIKGKKLRLGTYPTPELAHAAWLMAGQQMQAGA